MESTNKKVSEEHSFVVKLDTCMHPSKQPASSSTERRPHSKNKWEVRSFLLILMLHLIVSISSCPSLTTFKLAASPTSHVTRASQGMEQPNCHCAPLFWISFALLSLLIIKVYGLWLFELRCYNSFIGWRQVFLCVYLWTPFFSQFYSLKPNPLSP